MVIWKKLFCPCFPVQQTHNEFKDSDSSPSNTDEDIDDPDKIRERLNHLDTSNESIFRKSQIGLDSEFDMNSPIGKIESLASSTPINNIESNQIQQKNVHIHFPLKSPFINGAILSKEEYEIQWKTMNHETKSVFTLKLKKEITLEELEQFLEKRFIYTLASGNVGTVIKLYTYTQDEEDRWYLMELLFDQETVSMNVKLKTVDNITNKYFLKILESIFDSL